MNKWKDRQLCLDLMLQKLAEPPFDLTGRCRNILCSAVWRRLFVILMHTDSVLMLIWQMSMAGAKLNEGPLQNSCSIYKAVEEFLALFGYTVKPYKFGKLQLANTWNNMEQSIYCIAKCFYMCIPPQPFFSSESCDVSAGWNHCLISHFGL